jgi:hypothetical protein
MLYLFWQMVLKLLILCTHAADTRADIQAQHGCDWLPHWMHWQAGMCLPRHAIHCAIRLCNMLQNYASDWKIRLLMHGQLEDSGHSNVAQADILQVYADIMRSKHVMSDVLEQYVLAHILKRDIWSYNADTPALFPCLQYAEKSVHTGSPLRIQYCKLLKPGTTMRFSSWNTWHRYK